MTTAAEEAARPAVTDDFGQIVALAAELRAGMAEQRGGPLWESHDALAPVTVADLAARTSNPTLATLVGTLDGFVLAYGLARLEPIARGNGTLGVIDELFVAEPARAVGVGEVLLAALVSWCRDAHCIGIDATALPGDRQAKNFFESAGFKARRLIMHTDL